MSIKQNITSLQNLLEQVNALPDSGGVELPELSNPAIAAEVFANKELIDADGNKIVGTFTIDNELTVQDDLISQIQAAVDGLPEAGSSGSDSSDEVKLCTVEILTNNDYAVIYSTLNENGQAIITWVGNKFDDINTHSLTVICGSYIFVPIISTVPAYDITGDSEFIERLSGSGAYRTMVFKINGTSTINCYDDD